MRIKTRPGKAPHKDRGQAGTEELENFGQFAHCSSGLMNYYSSSYLISFNLGFIISNPQ